MRIETVGVLGGTFDPVHLAHLEAAEAARREAGLRRVLLVPCAVPPHKDGATPAPAEHRLEMLRLAVEGRPGLEISTIEIERGGTSFTIETLRALRDGPLRCRPVFILGTDSLADIESWREHRALLDEFDLLAVRRPGLDVGALRAKLGSALAARVGPVPSEADPPIGWGGRVFLLEASPSDVSSSRIRENASRGASLDGLVPPEVARYIRANRLYRGEDRS